MHCQTVIISEDEPVIALDLQQILQEQGLHVIQAEDPGQLPDLCARLQPALVLLNFEHRFGPDGVALARTLAQRFFLRVMILTGARPKDVSAVPDFDAGMAVLYKPFTRAQLLRSLDRLIS